MSFMDGWMKGEFERARLEELKEKFNTAEKLGVSECQKCGFCCHKRTCIPTPSELVEISKFLNLTVKETINKYFCMDSASFSSIYYVKPAGINNLDLVGKYIPNDRTYNEGKCVFLTDENLCKIYTVRPEQAKKQACWKKPTHNKNINFSWREGVLEKIIGCEING